MVFVCFDRLFRVCRHRFRVYRQLTCFDTLFSSLYTLLLRWCRGYIIRGSFVCVLIVRLRGGDIIIEFRK